MALVFTYPGIMIGVDDDGHSSGDPIIHDCCDDDDDGICWQ